MAFSTRAKRPTAWFANLITDGLELSNHAVGRFALVENAIAFPEAAYTVLVDFHHDTLEMLENLTGNSKG